MATRTTDRDRHDPRDTDEERAAVARFEAVEILAGAILELLQKGGPGLSPDGPLRPRRGPDSAISGQIRTPG